MAKQYTRNMIRSVFIDMLDERPLDEITVTDLVARCEINRKTFYYYFSDLYAVLTEIFEEELERVFAHPTDTHTWEEGFLEAVHIIREHKRAVYHIYHSAHREELNDYLYKVAGNVIARYVEHVGEGVEADEDDKQIIVQFYQCALTQMVLHWIGDGMKGDSDAFIHRIGQLFEGNVSASLARSASMKKEPWDDRTADARG